MTDKKQTVHVPLEPAELQAIDDYIAGHEFPIKRCHVMQLALRKFLSVERTIHTALDRSKPRKQ